MAKRFPSASTWFGRLAISAGMAAILVLVAGVVERSAQAQTRFPFNLPLAGALGDWSLTGNSGTHPVMNYLGTSDNQALEFRVNAQRALRIEPNGESPSFLGGFSGNSISSGTAGAVIAGGGRSSAINEALAAYGVISGGLGNKVRAVLAVVGGGSYNVADGDLATVVGGTGNTSSGGAAVVAGGAQNTAAGSYAAIGGGYDNEARGEFSTIVGGSGNVALGHYSVVAGRRATNADTRHMGVFMFSDATNADFFSTAANQFSVRASGGYRLFSDATLTSGVILSPGSSSWSVVSDVGSKANFTPVNTVQILDALATLPLRAWNLVTQPVATRHIGPVAQEFNAAFGYLLGTVESPIHINMMDAVGVALAASQGLYAAAQGQTATIRCLREEANRRDALLADLAARSANQAEEILDLRARIEALERLVQEQMRKDPLS